MLTALLSQENKETGRKLFLATGCMFTLPIITYYFTFYWLFSHKDQPENWAALVSILVVNIIIGIYTYSAFTEPEDETRMSQPRNKSDKIRTD